MNRSPLIWLPISGVLGLAGCAAYPDKPYVFAQTRVAGISAAAGPGAGGADFTLGYRQRDVVFVPTAAVEGTGVKETPSVIAQFEPQGGTHGGMGKFFASGKAAEQLAAGLAKERPLPTHVAQNAKPSKSDKMAKAR
jgi:hypothetical protein